MGKGTVCGIYRIYNTQNHKAYFGASSHIYRRWSGHRHRFASGTHTKSMQRDWDRYGEWAFEFTVVEVCAIEVLHEREDHYIHLWPKDRLYNAKEVFAQPKDHKAPRGEALKGRKHSEATKAKMSASAHRRAAEKPLDEAARAKISEKAKERMSDPTRREAAAKHLRTWRPTKAIRKKISESNRGKKRTPEQCARISEAVRASHARNPRTHSEETKAKIRAHSRKAKLKS